MVVVASSLLMKQQENRPAEASRHGSKQCDVLFLLRMNYERKKAGIFARCLHGAPAQFRRKRAAQKHMKKQAIEKDRASALEATTYSTVIKSGAEC